MALFGRTKARRARILTASGTRIDLTNRESVRRLAQSRTAQTWQADAWAYRDMIGELRMANEFVARAVARVKFYAAAVVPDEDEPMPFDAHGVTLPNGLADAAAEELERLPLDAGYRFLGVLTENLKITGECWLHGYQDDAGEEVWEVLSVSEVVLGQDGQISIRRHGEGISTPVDSDGNEEMLRLWVPHPRWSNLADSPMRALQDVCEDIILAGREIRAVARSRIASNGLFKIPRGLALLSATSGDTINADDAGFMAELTAVLTAPINNEGHPGAVAPGGIVGELEDLAGFDHIRIDRESSEEIIQKVEQSLARLARGLDIPPEIITGMGDANHWSAWQIDSSTYRYHIDPTVRTVADALTEAFLRPALIARGYSPADVRKVTVWRDSGVLTENPNRGQDAKDAFDRGAIGFKALADALGFNEADAPSDDELVKMIALKVGVDTSTSALLLRAALGPGNVPEPPAPVAPPRVVESQRVDAPGQTPPDNPQDATPATQPPGMTAAGRALVQAVLADAEPSDDGWELDDDGSRALAAIDALLLDRMLVAAEEALERGLEKAGARVRSKTNGKADMRDAIDGAPVTHMAAVIGPAGVMKLGLTESELLAGIFDRLEERWTAWVNAGIAEGVRVVLRMLRIRRDTTQGQVIADRLTNSMSARMPRAWAELRDQLMRTAERVLYAPDEDVTGHGETSRFRIAPRIIRRALAAVGGTPADADADRPILPGGIGTGADVAAVLGDHGAAQIGFEWLYGVADRNTFEPHYDLDGERFTSWADDRLVPPAQYSWVGPYLHPGDHPGCQCTWQPTWLMPPAQPADRTGLANRIRRFRDRWLRRNRG